MIRQSSRVLLLWAAAATLLLAVRVLPATAAEPPFVPTFVDPHVHLDKPEFGRGRVIRLLTTDDHPPFNFRAPDGTLVGYNVDLARAACLVIGVVCSIEARGFESLVPSLQAQAGDAVIASLAITERAREAVDFSLPTMRMAARFATRKGAVPPTVLPETVERLVIGVQAGTAHEAYLRAFFPRAVLKPYLDPDSLRAGLRSGSVDLMFADGLSTALWLNGSAAAGCCQFVGGPFTESRYFGEGTGIAVRKGDLALKAAFDYALQRLSADGTTADLYLKYFPVGFF